MIILNLHEMKFIRIDADNIGDQIELALMNNDIEKAKEIASSVEQFMRELKAKLMLNPDFKILMAGCDDVLLIFDGDQSEISRLLEEIRIDFFSITTFTISIGIGDDLFQAIFNLKKAKLSGKNRVVGL